MKKVKLVKIILCLSLFLGLGLNVGSSFVEASSFDSGIVRFDKDNKGKDNKDKDEDENNEPTVIPEYNDQLKEAHGQYKENNIDQLYEQVKPAANKTTKFITTPVMSFFNTVIFLVLTFINTYFFVQTCFDIAFLIAPGIRNWMTGNQSNDSKSGKFSRFCGGMVSEAALNSVGYVRNKDGGENHIASENMVDEVDWKYWLIKRVSMFICIMAYLALLMMGLLDDFVSLFTHLAYALLDAIFELIDPADATGIDATPTPTAGN